MLLLVVVSLLQTPAQSPLSLSEAWEAALRGRGVAAAAGASVAAASGGVRLAGQVPNPTLLLSATGAAPGAHGIVDQPLSWMLTRGADQGAARAALAGARADSTATLARLGAEVRRAFYGLLGRDARQRLLVDQQGVADSLARIARRRFDAGDISQFELEQVDLESHVQSQLLAAEQVEVDVARAELARVIGWPEARVPPLSGALDDGLVAEAEGAPAHELPLVLVAEADSLQGAAALGSVRRARIPFPSLEFGVEWNDPAAPGRTYGVLGVLIPVPLWNQGGSQVAEAEARADAASAAVIEARLVARQRLEEAQVRLSGTAARAVAARDSLVPAAARLRSRALAAYRAGETGLVPVLEAVRREREIQLAEVDALIAFQDAVAALHELRGEAP
jgi:cobalt-zinc-cadmium efflux system outer membrane protein